MNLEKSSITFDEVEKEESEIFFFDTYAFYEIIKENQYYAKYLTKKIVTSKLNLFELTFIFLKENNFDLALSSLDSYYPFVNDFDREVIIAAVRLKKNLNKRDVSMTDCVGYVMAKQLGIKFLTGDSAFESMENVEFVR